MSDEEVNKEREEEFKFATTRFLNEPISKELEDKYVHCLDKCEWEWDFDTGKTEMDNKAE